MNDQARDYPFQLSDQQWRERLTEEQYQVLRHGATERPGSCALLHEKRAGRFACAGCNQVLFVGDTKYESHSGWPSFNTPEPGSVEELRDTSHGMIRTEVRCARCGGHLGHVFPDGPPPSFQRYCINGVALTFIPNASAT
ncbi:peptide-methionine (R)-S-oxide reductase MsrB [Oleiagrimonas sp. C23AA]|uniref:peptide-methionine (R)-S-oxide reductase MsrB n=1 Tax=Oleiagrimonas sp. C23AA TaxID=2719047 RepID=UPI0014221BCC|nr:peptide-methionine (R)-S-oxide reductase MsrB [Oleiagrimonas sp. C23AA]NII10795.1 peptide-methionine (R)-S-oxide reductase MsrB [Oleiagrimonas sp. C23AA]